MNCFFRLVLAGVAAAFLSFSPVVAQVSDSGAIRDIVIQGNQRIEPETIRSYLSITEGETFSSSRVDRALKSLFATGLFADVSIHREGDSLIVSVVENPIINRLAFEGNNRVKADQLQPEIQLRPRTVYTRTKVQNDVKRILEIYRRNGRFAATVEPKLIELPQNRVDLVFEINEGPRTYVSRINFVGNKEFSDGSLREVLQTKEERWYRFLTADDSYDPDRVNYDRELLRRFYLREGYADFRVVSTVAELSPDRENFYLTFTLEEGEPYRVGKTAVTTMLPDLKIEALEPLLTFKSGDWYNADEIENTILALTDAVGTAGYAFVDIKPQLVRNRENHTLDITFDIQEGARVYVERINIQGNVRTQDKVIRREFRLVEGDAFNSAKLRRSRERINDLNFFENVEINNVPSETAADRTVVNVDVTEKSTGELSFGIGWSSSVGALLEVGARERNLLGRGQDLRVTGTLAQERTSIDMGFTEPYFLDRRLAAGFDLYNINTTQHSTYYYDAKTYGGALRMGYFYNEYLRSDWRYGLSSTNVTHVDSDASFYIKEQAGKTTMSSLSHTFTYDRRDSKIEPSRGYYMRLGTEFAGLGGSEQFVRATTSAGKYFKLAEDTVLMFGAGAGYMWSYSDRKINITQRFYLGGDNLRGFEDAGVSPRDKATRDPLGGLWQYTGTANLTFPVGAPKEMGIKGKLFVDAGGIGKTDSSVPSDKVYSSSAPRMSIGTGVIWTSPMGPINIDLAVPVIKKDYDETEFFRLNFGTRF